MPKRRQPRITMLGLALVLSFSETAVVRAQVEPRAGTVRGTVRRDSDGATLRGVSVVVEGAGLAAVTEAGGRYVLARVPAGAQVLVFRQPGYQPLTRRVTVGPGEVTTLDVSLTPQPVILSEIVVEAPSRAPERIVEAPAAVSVAEGAVVRDLAVTGQLPLVLAAMPGVDIVQSSVFDFNVNARGLNSSVNRRVLVLQDGRDLVIPLVGASAEWNALAVPLDEAARVELVRGPGSALYGANAFAGVLDIRTPAPREAQGSRITVAGGELATFRADARTAGVLSRGRVGYRINAGYARSDTWSRSRTAGDSLDLAREYRAATDRPAPRVREARPLRGQTLDSLGVAVGERDPLFSVYGSGRLDYYLPSGVVVTAEGGTARAENEVVVTGIGRVQVTQATRPWFRANIGSTRFNVMAWYSGREATKPMYALGAGTPLEDRSSIYHVEGQFNQALGGTRARLVAGASYRSMAMDTRLTLMAAEDDKRRDDTYSAFGQLDLRLTSFLRGVLAARWDDGSLFESQVSPKAALVLLPRQDHALRVSVNRAFQTPSPLEFFLNVPAGSPLATPRQLETGIEAYYAGVAGAVAAGQLPPSVTAGLDLSPLPWDFDSLVTVEARGNRDLNVERVTGWELGYRGRIGRRGIVTVDLFRNDMRDFVTDLLPGVNPAYPTYLLLDQGRDVPTTLDSLDARLAALGLPPSHPLRAPIPTLQGGYNQLNTQAGPFLSTLPDGRRALVVSYTNAGRVIAQGVELGVAFAVTDRVRLEGSVTRFDFEVRERRLGDVLLANTPRWKGTIGCSYADGRLDLGFAARFVEDMEWAAGALAGYVPSSRSVTVTAGYRLTRTLRAHALVTNVTDERRYQLFGGSVIGRRALAGVTADF